MIKSAKYPNMFSLALDKDETVKSLCSKFLEDSFLLSLSTQTYEEFVQLEDKLAHIHLQMGNCDDWSFIWNSSVYTAKLAVL